MTSLDASPVRASSTEILESTCPYDHEQFAAGDMVVRCPVCERWHHVNCWRENGNHCAVHGCNGEGQVRDYSPSPSQGETIEDAVNELDLFGEITIITPIESEAFDLPWIDIPIDSVGDGPLPMISIDEWELALDKAVKSTQIDRMLAKVGLQSILERHVKGEHYFLALGSILLGIAAALIIVVVLLIIILANI